jgi:hypothetical protein
METQDNYDLYLNNQLYICDSKIDSQKIIINKIKGINIEYIGYFYEDLKKNIKYCYKITTKKYNYEDIMFELIKGENIDDILYFVNNSEPLKLPNRWSDPYRSMIVSAIHTGNDNFVENIIDLIRTHDKFSHFSDVYDNIISQFLKFNCINSMKIYYRNSPNIFKNAIKSYPEYYEILSNLSQ